MAPMPYPKEDCQAGLVRYPDGSEKMVVAGGLNDKTTSILDLQYGIWLPGPALPHDIYIGAEVPFGDSYLIVGGCYSDGLGEEFLSTI